MVAERFRATLAEQGLENNGQKITVTCSIGLTEHKFQNQLADTMRIADANLYRAKEEGRNRVHASA